MKTGSAAGPVRLIIFDLDGTLLHAAGAGRRAIQRALLRCFGREVVADGRQFAGRSDVAIFRELAVQAGVAAQELSRRWDELVGYYLTYLAEELQEAQASALPGVVPLLESLRSRPDVALALGTGNLEAGARLKLQRCGLAGYFPVGGYGADGEVRHHILHAACRRAALRLGRPPSPVVVVGDTPLDVQAARQVGYLPVGVATGPYTADELRRCGAAVVLPSLADWVEAARCLTTLTPDGLQ